MPLCNPSGQRNPLLFLATDHFVNARNQMQVVIVRKLSGEKQLTGTMEIVNRNLVLRLKKITMRFIDYGGKGVPLRRQGFAIFSWCPVLVQQIPPSSLSKRRISENGVNIGFLGRKRIFQELDQSLIALPEINHVLTCFSGQGPPGNSGIGLQFA